MPIEEQRLSSAMRPARPRWLGVVGVSGIAFLLFVLLMPESISRFLAINLTPSLPRGVYRVTRLQVRPGVLVTFCLPPELVRRYDLVKWIAPGRCPGGRAPLCKRIVQVGPGKATCGSVSWQIAAGEVFVRGESSRSQDSCVFGPVPMAWLRDRVVPVWTF